MKKGKQITNANLNYNEYAIFNDLEIDRNFVLTEKTSNFSQNFRIAQRYKNLFFSGASNYELNKSHNLSLNVQASNSNYISFVPSFTEISNPLATENNFLDSKNGATGQSDCFFGNIHYEGKLDTMVNKIISDIESTRMNSDSEALLSNLSYTGQNPKLERWIRS